MFLLCAVLSVACFAIVQMALYRDNPKLAVFGLLSLGAFTWLWGWVFWRSTVKVPVMAVWTISAATCLILR